MILGFSNEEIVKLAIKNQSEHFDGVVQYDWKEDKIYGCSMAQNEQENPLNSVIEVFRLKQGEKGIIEYNCDECPFQKDSNEHSQCCMNVYIDEYFEDDFEDKFEESLREQIREVIYDNFEDLDICESIYLRISEICDSTTLYQQKLFNDDYKQNCVDCFEDNFYENGFPINLNKECLTVEIDGLAISLECSIDGANNSYNQEKIDFVARNQLSKALNLLREEKLTECLEILNNSECYYDEWGKGL